jgi:hypothetical protein
MAIACVNIDIKPLDGNVYWSNAAKKCYDSYLFEEADLVPRFVIDEVLCAFNGRLHLNQLSWHEVEIYEAKKCNIWSRKEKVGKMVVNLHLADWTKGVKKSFAKIAKLCNLHVS